MGGKKKQHKACLVGLNGLYPSASNYSLWTQHPWWSLSLSLCLSVSPFFLFHSVALSKRMRRLFNEFAWSRNRKRISRCQRVFAVAASEDVFSWQNKYANRAGCNTFGINLGDLTHCFKMSTLLLAACCWGWREKKKTNDHTWTWSPQLIKLSEMNVRRPDVWRADRLVDLSLTAVARSAQNNCPPWGCGETRSFHEWSRYLQRYITADQRRVTACFYLLPRSPVDVSAQASVTSVPSTREHGCSLVSWCIRCVFLRQLVSFVLNVHFKRLLQHLFMTWWN